MTVCEIARNPAKFKNASVFIHASVISDGIERVGFEDAQCPNSVLLLLGAETEQGRKDLKRLTDAIYQGRPGTLDKDIDVEVVGVIRAKKGDEDTTIYGMMLEELKRLSVKKH
jgi:hypothetical protein